MNEGFFIELNGEWKKIAGGGEGCYSLNFILPAHYIYVDKTTTTTTSIVLFYNKAKNKSHKINKEQETEEER